MQVMPASWRSIAFSAALSFFNSACLGQHYPPAEPSVPIAAPEAAGGGNTADANSPSGGSAGSGAASAATDRPTCSGLGTWDAQAGQFEAEVLALVNAARARGVTCGGTRKPAMPPLKSDAKLDCIARSYAKSMSEQDFFSHTGLDGSSPFDRMKTAYSSYRGAAENIALGQTTAQEVMDSWLTSTGHCENIMGDFTVLGVGMYRDVWVQDFIKP